MGDISRYFLLRFKEFCFVLIGRPDFPRCELFAFGYARYFDLLSIRPGELISGEISEWNLQPRGPFSSEKSWSTGSLKGLFYILLCPACTAGFAT